MSFVEDVAYRSPVPGGGSAAAHCAACSTALMFKVMKVWREQPGCFDAALVDRIGMKLEKLMEAFSVLESEDAKAYLAFSEARKSAAILPGEDVVLASMAPPLAILEHCLETLRDLFPVCEKSPLFLRADMLVGLELLGSAFNGAHHIARSNLRFFSHGQTLDRLETHLAEERFAFARLHRATMESLSGLSRLTN